MKVLVTGAAGFVGKHTVALLQGSGYDIITLDKNGACADILADILEVTLMDNIFRIRRPDAVIHLAAQSSVAVSMKDWVNDAENNIIGTLNLIKCCQKYGVKRIVFASSGGTVYGEPDVCPVPEDCPVNPLSPYGISKLAGEFYIKISGISHAILRYPNVYGPGQPSGESGIIAIFINNILNNRICTIFGDGESTRDYVYVEDIARANLMALESKSEGVFNIGSGKEISVKRILKTISGLMGLCPTVQFKPIRDGEVKRICFDAGRAKRLLGWKPTMSTTEGIKLTIENMQGGQCEGF